MKLFVVGVLGLVSSVAAADPGSLAGVEAQEPASDRVFTTPTALTVPAGSVDVSGEVERNTDALVQAAVGITQTTELSVLGGRTWGTTGDRDSTYGVGGTQQLYRNRRIAVALHVAATRQRDGASHYTWLAGGAAITGCVDDGCLLRLSADALVTHYSWDNFPSIGLLEGELLSDTTLVLGASAVAGSGPVRAMLDVSRTDFDWYVLAGVRLTQRHFAVDAGIGNDYLMYSGDIPVRLWLVRVTVRP